MNCNARAGRWNQARNPELTKVFSDHPLPPDDFGSVEYFDILSLHVDTDRGIEQLSALLFPPSQMVNSFIFGGRSASSTHTNHIHP